MTNPTTVVGARTLVKGHLQGDEDIMVVGRVDGAITLSKTLFVDQQGVIVADVQVTRAVVSGTVIGNITATELIQITEEGRVAGDLNTPRLILNDGASFNGKIEMGERAAPNQERSSSVELPSRITRPTRRTAAVGTSTAVRDNDDEEPSMLDLQDRNVAPTIKISETHEIDAALAEPEAGAAKSKQRAPKRTRTKSAASDKTTRPPKPPTTAGKKTRARRK